MKPAARWVLPALFLVAACAPIPKPAVLADVDAVRQGAAAEEAKVYAPGAYARAEKLRREAVAAADEDLAGAQIIGEHAIAAYAHAHALARVARAEAAALASEGELARSLAEVHAIEADQTQVGAEVDALELRVRVTRDAQPVVASGPADASREKARLQAAKALALQARLLCGAARLLLAEAGAPAVPTGPAPAAADPVRVELDAATAALQKLETSLGATAPAASPRAASPVPIDLATRAREGCLAALTKIRRAATPVSKVPGAGDALLAALSATGATPSRDDRGVFVTLRGIFDKGGLSKAGHERIAELGRVAAAHPEFPVSVVIHQDKETPGREDATSRARADAMVSALKGAQAPRVEAVLAGAVAPVVDPSGKDRARNARVEIVFVTPEAF